MKWEVEIVMVHMTSNVVCTRKEGDLGFNFNFNITEVSIHRLHVGLMVNCIIYL